MPMTSYIAAPIIGAVAAIGLLEIGDVVLPPMIEGYGDVTGEAVPGREVLVNWVITKRTECPGVTSRAWFGEGGFQLTEPLQATALPVGENMAYSIPTRVPGLAPAGDLELHIVGAFNCPGETPSRFDLGPVMMVVKDGAAAD